MSLSLDWLWGALQGVVNTVTSWFSGIESTLSKITNVGQGIWAGLVSIGSAIWDAIVKFAGKIVEAFGWLGELGSRVKDAFVALGEWLWRALGSIPQAIYSGLQWLYNGLAWLGSQFVRLVESAYNWLRDFVSSIPDMISKWIGGLASSVNSWWTGVIKRFRDKLRQSLTTTLTIHWVWDSVETASKSGRLTDMLTLPFKALGAYVGASLLATVVDAMLPVPHTVNFELIPTVSLPSVTLPRLTVPAVPEPLAPREPAPPAIGYGLPYDVSLTIAKAAPSAYTQTWDSWVIPGARPEASTSASDLAVTPATVTVETVVA